MENKKKAKQKQRFDTDEKGKRITYRMDILESEWNQHRSFILVGSDCILHGYIKKLGGPFASAWQTRYAKLYPNRLELHPESATKPELIFLDQVSIIYQG